MARDKEIEHLEKQQLLADQRKQMRQDLRDKEAEIAVATTAADEESLKAEKRALNRQIKR